MEAAIKRVAQSALSAQDQAQIFRDVGERFENQGDIAAVLEARRAAVQFRPLDRQVTIELLRALMKYGSPQELDSAAADSALSESDLVAAFRALGGEFLAANNTELAVASAKEALRRAPVDRVVLSELLRILIMISDHHGAQDVLAAARPEDRIPVLRDLAGEFSRNGNEAASATIRDLSAATAPDASVLYVDFIRDRVFAGDIDGAVAIIDAAPLPAKTKSAVFGDLGSDLFGQNRVDLALRCRRIARDFAPGDTAVQRELIQAALKFEGRDAALAEAEKADFTVEGVYRHDFTALEKLIYTQVCDIAIASPELVVGLVRAAQYVLRAKIPGAFVESGTFRGGSSMAVMLALLAQNVSDRDFYLYDTFTGFPLPDEVDLYYDGRSAIEEWEEKKQSDGQSGWLVSTLEQTRANVLSTGYPEQRITLVKGMVEDTIPAVAPEQIAFLRLDTDFYVSTRHELDHLYDRIAPGGVLIIDDYGAFQGARKAVDEFFENFEHPPFLHRVDSNVRLAIKDWAPEPTRQGKP